jgi:hypothetical protein
MDDCLCGLLRMPGLAEKYTGSHPYRGQFPQSSLLPKEMAWKSIRRII